MEENVTVCGKTYRLLRLLGHGKGGYSWLAEGNGRRAVVKQIHHEPCDYYTFGDKFASEIRDYGRLREAGIPVPELIAADRETERIVKAYVEGETVLDRLREGGSAGPYLEQVRAMAEQARRAGLNIDYFPANFVICGGELWYVDYECNAYDAAWDFEHWGLKYWSRTETLEAWLRSHGPEEGGTGP